MIELSFILIVFALLFCITSIFDDKTDKFFEFLCLIVLILLFINETDISKKPTAMDVYQGKTELEITTVNGVAKDSTVIFKN